MMRYNNGEDPFYNNEKDKYIIGTKSKVSNFCLRKFAKVVPFCELYVADVDINTRNS